MTNGISPLILRIFMGGHLGGSGGRPPPQRKNLRWGYTAHAFVPPNICEFESTLYHHKRPYCFKTVLFTSLQGLITVKVLSAMI